MTKTVLAVAVLAQCFHLAPVKRRGPWLGGRMTLQPDDPPPFA